MAIQGIEQCSRNLHAHLGIGARYPQKNHEETACAAHAPGSLGNQQFIEGWLHENYQLGLASLMIASSISPS